MKDTSSADDWPVVVRIGFKGNELAEAAGTDHQN